MSKKYFSRINLKTLTTFAAFILISIFSVLPATAGAIQSNDTIKAYNLLLKADSLTSSAKYDSANFYYELAAESYIKVAESNSLLSIVCTNRSIHCKNKKGWNLVIYLGKQQEAIIILTEILKLRKDTSTTIACTYRYLGIAHAIAGFYDKAINYYNISLRIYRTEFGDTNKFVGKCYSNIGLAYYSKGEFDLAIKFMEISNQAEVNSKSNKNSIIQLVNVGNIYRSIGSYDKASDNFNEALSVYLKDSTIEDNYLLSAIYSGIGIVKLRMGDYYTALDQFKKDLALVLNIGDYNHPTISNSYINIGIVLFELKRFEEALEYYKKALSIKKEAFDANHPDMAIVYNNIANIYLYTTDYNNALSYYNKALDIRIKSLGIEHILTARTYANLAVVHLKMDQHNRALELQNKSLKIVKEQLGNYHPNTGNDYILLGNIYENKKEYKYALDIYQKALAALCYGMPQNYIYGGFELNESQINSNQYFLDALIKKADVLYSLFQ